MVQARASGHHRDPTTSCERTSLWYPARVSDPESQIDAPADPAAERAALERFVIDNDELADLEAVIGRFNIFDALRVVDKELEHSNFLAWLLDPIESHGQGQLFLRAILMDMLRASAPDKRPISPIRLDGEDMTGVLVRREWNNIDLLITAEKPRVVIAIENKIWSEEHSNQLCRYRKTILEELPDHEPLFIFLTREGDPPSDEHWVPYSYEQLHDALLRCLNTNRESIGTEIAVFLDHYLRIIRSRFMSDEKIEDLCNTIYRKHRQALDLIFDRRGDPRARVIQAVTDILNEHEISWDIRATKYKCVFWPTAWNDLVPDIGTAGKRAPKGFLRFTLNAWPGQLYLETIVAPSSDPEVRGELLDAIADRGTSYGFKKLSKSPGKEWATVYSTHCARNKDGLVDDEKTLDAIKKLIDDLAKRSVKMTELLKEVFVD